MLQTWKFSKGIILTALATAIIWLLLLGFAYQQHRSSEILTGVIGGLTIILGMITAEWLRASREQVELTRARFYELMTHLERYLYNFDEYMRDQYSHENSEYMEDFIHVFSPLSLLARITRWPQPNAKKIREAALELHVKVAALQMDADENGHIWSLEKRMKLAGDISKIQWLIWARSPQEVDSFRARTDEYRETPRNQETPVQWTRKTR